MLEMIVVAKGPCDLVSMTGLEDIPRLWFDVSHPVAAGHGTSHGVSLAFVFSRWRYTPLKVTPMPPQPEFASSDAPSFTRSHGPIRRNVTLQEPGSFPPSPKCATEAEEGSR